METTMKIQTLPFVSGLLILVTAGVSSVVGQTGGTVNFANDNSCLVTNGQTGAAITGAQNVQAGLYWAPTNSSSFTLLAGTAPVGTPLPGIFVGGTRTNGPGTPGGAVGQFQVRAWAGGHATYEAAAAINGTLVGTSAVLQVITGNPNGTPPTPPGSCRARD
jgi:hypothetical protein